MTFIETLLATSTTLFCAWLFNQYIQPLLNRGHNRILKMKNYTYMSGSKKKRSGKKAKIR
jgi:hypothetical protein